MDSGTELWTTIFTLTGQRQIYLNRQPIQAMPTTGGLACVTSVFGVKHLKNGQYSRNLGIIITGCITLGRVIVGARVNAK